MPQSRRGSKSEVSGASSLIRSLSPHYAISALDTAKEIVRIGSTAGLGKDVIDLLEKKTALLTEQVSALDRENVQLREEVVQLRQQLQRLQPVDGILKETSDVLKCFFDQGRELSVEHVARHFQFQMSVAESHFDVLFKREFVRQTRMGSETYGRSRPAMFGLTSEGRSYVMQNRAG
jgi:hypothetical protein